MAERVVSIKIGYSVTQVAEVDYETKNPRVYHAFSVDTPEGVIDDSGVHVTEEFIALFKKGMTDAGIKNDRAIFTMSSTRVATREVTIPLVKDNKIKSLLIANSKDYFPVDLSEYQLVYRIIEKQKNEKQIKLMVYAVPNALVQSYQTMSKALDFQLVAIDYYGNALYQAMAYSMNTKLAATICIDDNNSIITILKDGQIALQRTIGYGIDDAVHAMLQSNLVKNDTTYSEALTMMQMNQSIGETLHPDPDEEIPGMSKSVKNEITSSLTMLIGNLSRVLDYFLSRNSDVELTRISLVGLGADCLGLDRLLSNELDVYVETVRKFGSVDVTREMSAQRFHLGEYYACIGTAIKPLNFSFATAEEKDQSTSLKLPVIVCAGCVAISIAVLLVSVLSNMFLALDNESMRQEISSKQDAVDTYNSYLTNKVIHDSIGQLDTLSDVPADVLLDFLAELEEKMPSDMTVTDMAVEDSAVSMSFSCTSKASAAEALIQLRTFQNVAYLTSEGIKEEEGDTGATEVTFDVSFTFVKTFVTDEATEDGAAESTEAVESTEATE